MKTLIVTVIAIIGFSMKVGAQEKSNKELKGDKYTFSYSYDKAIDSYINSKQLSSEGQRKLAESYCKIDSTILGEDAWSKLINTSAVLPDDYYNYAMVLKTNGKYTESDKWMDQFNKLKPDDLRAKSYAANKAKFNELVKENGIYTVRHLSLNTKDDDFGTSYYKDKIVFVSNRVAPKLYVKKDNWRGDPFMDMYISDLEQGELKTPGIFVKSLDGKMHDGPASFSNDGIYMAFTRDHYHDKSKDRVVELQIYFSNYKDSKWSKPESFIFNNSAYNVGHPCLTGDGNTMYFTSDMPGGLGGTDLYKTVKDEKGTWRKPENLGTPINTEGNEMFPFFEEKNRILYFASNGHYGLGGLDLFNCELYDQGFGSVNNLGFPLNTRFDDFALIMNEKTHSGYFSSNRSGGSGGDDMYDFNIRKKIIGIAKDIAGNPIPESFVLLFDDKGSTMDTVTVKANAAYSFVVDPDKNFKLTGKRESYTDGSNTASTFGTEMIVRADVILLKPEKIISISKIYFDLDKYNIRPDAAIELDRIVKIMNENPNMVIELSSYTDCRETIAYNQILSDNRARESADYIKHRIISPERIYGKGYGETQLVNECACEGNLVSTCTEEEHQKNRRTEFLIIKK